MSTSQKCNDKKVYLHFVPNTDFSCLILFDDIISRNFAEILAQS